MKEDKETAIAFFRYKGIEARQIPKSTTGKTPDLELYLNNSLFGYSEIKSIVDYEFVGFRPDPSFNKIQKKIHEAVKQFAAYNPDHKVPNLLLFMNHFPYIRFGDLWTVLTGEVTPPSDRSDPIDVRYAIRLAQKNDLNYVDFIIWFDVKKARALYLVKDDSDFKKLLKARISSLRCEYLSFFA